MPSNKKVNHKEALSKKTISIAKANLLSFLIIPILSVPFYIYQNYWSTPPLKEVFNDQSTIFLFALLLVISVLIHELIHAFFFGVFSSTGFKDVKIGFIWKKLTPFAHCSKPIDVYQYQIALIMPALLIGIVPIVLSIFFGNYLMFIYGCFLTIAAGGDFVLLLLSLKVSHNQMLLDHPSECGFYIIDKK